VSGHRLTGTVVVDRPIDEVFAFLADGENDIKFSPRLKRIERTSGDCLGVGTTYESHAREMGLPTRHKFRITEFEPPHRIRWQELTKAPVYIGEGGYDLAPAGEGATEVTFFNDLEARGPGKLLVGSIHRRYAKNAPDFAQRIKRAVEAA
jgi:carbon monoxide dehydrogenase subunit G